MSGCNTRYISNIGVVDQYDAFIGLLTLSYICFSICFIVTALFRVADLFPFMWFTKCILQGILMSCSVLTSCPHTPPHSCGALSAWGLHHHIGLCSVLVTNDGLVVLLFCTHGMSHPCHELGLSWMSHVCIYRCRPHLPLQVLGREGPCLAPWVSRRGNERPRTHQQGQDTTQPEVH
jgi:hypothetical protein